MPESRKNHQIHKIQRQIRENHENLIMPCQNLENEEIHGILLPES